jgi:hypothetical protein
VDGAAMMIFREDDGFDGDFSSVLPEKGGNRSEINGKISKPNIEDGFRECQTSS